MTAGPIRDGRATSRPAWLGELRNAQRWRLASGLVLFTFVLTHFLNHALGLVSVQAMIEMQDLRRAVWRSPPGTLLLYGAATVHIALAIVRIVRRRTWRMSWLEAAQIGFGVAIPFLLYAHLAVTRGLHEVGGLDDSYWVVLRLLWPGLAFSQSLLLLVVWVHAMIGLHFWLRARSWYPAWSPALLVFAVLVPTLALTGWIEAARRIALMNQIGPPMPDALYDLGGILIENARQAVWSLAGGAVLLFGAVRLRARFKAGPRITYPGGRTVRPAPGATVLEASRQAGIPHAAICGGRGRCTTCRVLVTEGGAALDPPGRAEAAALARIGAPPGVRLACQVRPKGDLAVRPLMSFGEAGTPFVRDDLRWGVERRITVMFADLRDFTALAERLYPYDAVFLVNRYFEVMSEAVERHGGRVDKFLGDGIMALFGVEPARGSGARDALFAARDMLLALDRLSAEFEATLSRPLRMGIGLHTGQAVLGRVGAQRQAGLTALGDSVNIASRLEALNKEFGSLVVVSEATLAAAKLTIDGARLSEVPVRGREESLRVFVAQDLAGLHEAVEGMAT